MAKRRALGDPRSLLAILSQHAHGLITGSNAESESSTYRTHLAQEFLSPNVRLAGSRSSFPRKRPPDIAEVRRHAGGVGAIQACWVVTAADSMAW